MQGNNNPAMFRTTKFYSFGYPLTQVAAVHGTRSVVLDIKKYLQEESLARVFVRLSGNIVVAGASAGTATGNDNPEGLLLAANLTAQPQFQNVVPFNQVSERGLRIDALLNRGYDLRPTALVDTAGTVAIDQYYELNFKRSDFMVQGGVDYALPLKTFRQLLLTLTFGGRDQLFTTGTNTWDLSGLNVDIFADLDVGVNPQYIHSHELFEVSYAIAATTKDFKIDTLPQGFLYTDLYFLTESNNALADGILNNINMQSGSQVWFPKGEANAAALRQLFGYSNNRTLSAPGQSLTGIYPLPLRDGMFTRGFDARFAPLAISLDVTVVGTTNIRLVGRRMIPGGIYQRPPATAATH